MRTANEVADLSAGGRNGPRSELLRRHDPENRRSDEARRRDDLHGRVGQTIRIDVRGVESEKTENIVARPIAFAHTVRLARIDLVSVMTGPFWVEERESGADAPARARAARSIEATRRVQPRPKAREVASQ